MLCLNDKETRGYKPTSPKGRGAGAGSGHTEPLSCPGPDGQRCPQQGRRAPCAVRGPAGPTHTSCVPAASEAQWHQLTG